MSKLLDTFISNPTLSAMHRSEKIYYLTAFFLSVAAAFIIGRYSAKIHEVNISSLTEPFTVWNDHDPYGEFTNKMNSVRLYLVSNQGYIPPDFYDGLIQAGSFKSFYDFRIDDEWIVFDWYESPVRIHTNLALNAHAPLCRIKNSQYKQYWIFNFDGTIDRVDFGGKILAWDIQSAWSKIYRESSYPYWTNLEDKKKWVIANRENLVWNSNLKLFVPK